MTPYRIALIALFAGLLGAAVYLGSHGVGGESQDAARSFRSGSVGGPGGFGSVK